VRAAIRTFPSAYEVGFNFDIDECYVSYDAASKPDFKSMTKLIETRAGFKAWVHEEEWPAPETIEALRTLPR
jgi:hypothetical protein